jgi:hypothetical protein
MQHVSAVSSPNRQINADVVLRVAVTQISYNLFQNISHNLIAQLNVRAKYKCSGRQYAQQDMTALWGSQGLSRCLIIARIRANELLTSCY